MAKKLFQLYIDAVQSKWVNEKAAEEKRSRASIVREALKVYKAVSPLHCNTNKNQSDNKNE